MDLPRPIQNGGTALPAADGASLREEVEPARARVAGLRSQGKASDEAGAVTDVLFTLPGIPAAALPERATRKTGRNSGVPSSQTERT